MALRHNGITHRAIHVVAINVAGSGPSNIKEIESIMQSVCPLNGRDVAQ